MAIEFDGQNNKLGTTTANSVVIKTNDTDAVTVDSSQNVSLAGNINLGDNDKAQFGASNDLQIYHSGTNSFIYENGTGYLSLFGNGTDIRMQSTGNENMLIANSNGSVDLYYDNSKKLETSSSGATIRGDLLVIDGTPQIKFTDTDNNADAYIQGTDGNLRFFADDGQENASSNISFAVDGSEKARIDSSGQVGIGTSSPSQLLHLAGSSGANDGSIDNPITIRIADTQNQTSGSSDSTNPYGAIEFFSADTSDGARVQAKIGAKYGSAFGDRSDLVFFTAGAGANSALTEKMRINNSGNVGIGTTNTSLFNNAGGSSKLVVTGSNSTTSVISNTDSSIAICNSDTTTDNNAGLHFCFASTQNFAGASIVGILGTKVSGQYPAGQIAFLTSTATNSAPTEKMRIDSSGRLLVGTTSTTINTSNFGFVFDASTDVFKTSRNINGGGTSAEHFGNAGQIRFMGDGDAENTNNSYGALSDRTLKENETDANSQWNDIKALQIKNYNLIEYPDRPQIGVIAQDLEDAGMNGLVKTDDEGLKSVKYSVLYMKAVKALQEALIEIDNLKARVETLENA